jgi:hypothetical protein
MFQNCLSVKPTFIPEFVVGGFIVRAERSNGPNDGLRSIGDDAFVLLILSLEWPLVGQHDVIIYESGIEQSNVIRATSGLGVLTHSLPGGAGALGRHVVIVNETFATCTIQPTDGHVGSDHSCPLGISAGSERHVLPVICA